MMLRAAVALMLAFAAASADAQSGKRPPDGRERQMSPEQRERMRNDMRDAYRQPDDRPQKTRQMSPEERGQLRRDIEDANRTLRR